jgi:diacylglycerol O-acyltransferase
VGEYPPGIVPRVTLGKARLGHIVDRLGSVDTALWFGEDAQTPRNVGGVAIFRPPAGGFDHERLVRLVRNRIAHVPRYRQRLREVPWGLSRPIWVDDDQFDVAYHVRRSALPTPGTREQLDDLVARLMSRPLDRNRPLWEMYLIEGLDDGCFAVVTKSHQVLVDGAGSADIAQVMLDSGASVEVDTPDAWRPRPEPSDVELVAAALTSLATRPAVAWDVMTRTARDMGSATESLIGWARDTGVDTVRTVTSLIRTPDPSPLNTRIGAQRRFASTSVPLDDIQQIRDATVGTVNDVVLTVVTGALREWLMNRGRILDSSATLRALVPVSIHIDQTWEKDHPVTSNVGAFLIDLPVGEADPIIRLHQISFHMRDLGSKERFVAAQALASMAGFGPPTLHALGSRVGATLSTRAYNVSIINVPGPQRPLYAAGSELLAAYPFSPLVQGQALGIGLMSYRGSVFVGLTTDRESLSDVSVLVDAFNGSLKELQEAASKETGLRVIPGRADAG